MARIASVHARQILDSRGNPTLEVSVGLDDGSVGRASVPSGASTGKAEAVELRDHDPKIYCGRGVLDAVAHVEQLIAREVAGLDARDQQALDQKLISLDGTPNKQHLGGNTLLAVSLAVARAASVSAGLPLFAYLGGRAAAELPLPMVNILSGGMHGGGNADFQDFLVIPLHADSFSSALEDAASVYRAMKVVLQRRGLLAAGVADEGGYAPVLQSNELGFELMVEAIETAGVAPGKEAAIAIDVAASQLSEAGRYRFAAEGVTINCSEMVDRLANWVGRYPIVSIEDGLGEDDWQGWKALTLRLGSRCQLIGDDLFTTNLNRLRRGVQEGVANATLIKLNQAGTLSETLAAVNFARRHGFNTVISSRSGETEDDFIADLAVATGAGQIKIGSITRSERLAKYNRLLRIEAYWGSRARYAGAAILGDLAL